MPLSYKGDLLWQWDALALHVAHHQCTTTFPAPYPTCASRDPTGGSSHPQTNPYGLGVRAVR